MGLLDRLRTLFSRAEDAMNEVDYAAIDAVRHAEDRIDEATHGRYHDAVERVEEESGELLGRLHLDREPLVDGPSTVVDLGDRRDTAEDAAPEPPGAA
ncbi:MAG: hypothetical protein ACR2HI_00340 [Gaiella sp.]